MGRDGVAGAGPVPRRRRVPWKCSIKAVLKNMERGSRSVRTSHANRLG
jgi:hypothetical protein